MSKNRDDDELNQEEFTLEEVLAEFGSGSGGKQPSEDEEDRPLDGPDLPWPEPPHRDHPPEEEQRPDWREDTIPFPLPYAGEDSWKDDTIPFPILPREQETEPEPGEKKGQLSHFPPRVLREPEPEDEPEDELEDELEEEPEDSGDEEDGGYDEPQPAASDKVLEFPPPEPDSPLERLRRKADEFAGHMFEEEGEEETEEVRRAEELIPGVDEEEPPPVKFHRPHRRKARPAPDTPAVELFQKYAKGIGSQRVRGFLVFWLFVASLYLTLAEQFPLPVFDVLAVSGVLRCYALAGLQILALLLGIDAVVIGIARIFRFRLGLDTVAVLANLAVLLDAIYLPGEGDPFRQPYCAAAILSLWCVMKGNLNKQRGMRVACRTAASAHEPYLVTRDEGAWNGRDTYAKWSGEVVGFGSQVQGLDGAERIYRVFVPILLTACIAFSVLASLGRERPEDLLWCLSATLTASSALSATLCFGLPWRKLSVRLAKLGAALAGWEGVVNTTGSSNILIKDTDIFPRGAVKLNGVKVYGDRAAEKVMAYTATVIRDAGGGLNIPFRDMIRSEGLLYRQGEKFSADEGGGVSEYIRGDLVQVGSASYMTLMEVKLPKGTNVKNAVYCAINGELAGLFALHYRMSNAVEPALDSLIRNRVTPVLATRDFNLIPTVLRQRFKLPADKMEFPPVERRRALSDPEREHSDTLTAVLCREGVGPYAEAVVGGRRLRVAVRLSTALTCIGSAVGCLLAFYLTFVQAYQSLTPMNLLVFLVLWSVPTALLSHWVNQF